ncbi:hypothetical protein MNBD_GAMMA24-940 [hydrothermal vent metagenome]|uniref:Uncharacterized protein n=1 Tax=hydrothermal vent metagenome TaxID=652676 RepID=A0A3B1BQQ2_9ZZZZ
MAPQSISRIPVINRRERSDAKAQRKNIYLFLRMSRLVFKQIYIAHCACDMSMGFATGLRSTHPAVCHYKLQEITTKKIKPLRLRVLCVNYT